MDFNILRHSTAHLLAHAIHNLFPDTQFAIGPAINNGFYYDVLSNSHTFSIQDFPALEQEMSRLKSLNLPIVKKIIQKDAALSSLSNQSFKLELIEFGSRDCR